MCIMIRSSVLLDDNNSNDDGACDLRGEGSVWLVCTVIFCTPQHHTSYHTNTKQINRTNIKQSVKAHMNNTICSNTSSSLEQKRMRARATTSRRQRKQHQLFSEMTASRFKMMQLNENAPSVLVATRMYKCTRVLYCWCWYSNIGLVMVGWLVGLKSNAEAIHINRSCWREDERTFNMNI